MGRAYGPPRNFEGAAPLFYLNQGNGRFVERAAASGLVVIDPVTRAPAAKALGVALVDLDADRCLDLVVANDTVRNHAFRNRCDGTFEEVGTTLGLAYDSTGSARSGVGDRHRRGARRRRTCRGHRQLRQRDGRLLRPPAVGRLRRRGHRGRHRRGEPPAPHLRRAVLRLRPRRPARPADHQRPCRRPDRDRAAEPAARPAGRPLLERRRPEAPATFVPVADTGALAEPMVGRGGAYGDIDGDGDLDLLLVPVAGPVRLLRNGRPLECG
ncbi:MAG: VCBS repeat-containing protein [Vicinamibacterales bacterium]